MHRPLKRREFLHLGAATAACHYVPGRLLAQGQSPNEKLNVACIGVGGRGKANVSGVSKENIVAFCDVDDARAKDTYKKYPSVQRKYYDFRRMLDVLDSQIDAVVVSTPDHAHAHPAIKAMEMGKHLYCEKPMAHNVWEVRRMTELAAEKQLATQLGVQRHAMSNMHRVVELVKSGAIGRITEVHACIGTERGMPDMPTEFPEIPAGLRWDLWLGPARRRRYSPAFCPYNWRFWWDYGTGETGNWGCHVLDIPYWALDLGHSIAVKAEGPAVDAERSPKSLHVTYQFPARGPLDPVTLHWYQTTVAPPAFTENAVPFKGTCVLFLGTEGNLLTKFDEHWLLPETKFADFAYPEPFVPDSPGFHQEWIDACKGFGPKPTVHFDYSGPMAETVLLGNVAYRAGVGEMTAWDAATMTLAGTPHAEPLLRESYREGWEM